MPRFRPVVLVVLDGWGVAPPSPTNAISQAATPVMDRLIAEYPVRTLQASGEAVGLLWGEAGNSEVGHLAMGTGKILYQNLPKIHREISQGTFGRTPAFQAAFQHLAQRPGAKLHLVGLVSSGGVHSHQDHLWALLECCHQRGVAPYLHVILDGRDTARDAGAGFVAELQERLADAGGRIATIAGRFYAMDRDHHWERIERAYRAMVEGVGPTAAADDPVGAVRASYARGTYDEEFPPTVLLDGGNPVARVADHDAVIFFNFRADRARELTASIGLPGFDKFSRSCPRGLFVVTMTAYDRSFPVTVAFPVTEVKTTVAEVIATAGWRQLHVAETEKYAHVTFFFNGGRELAFPGEDRVLVPSLNVASFAATPAMSAYPLTEQLLKRLRDPGYDFAIVNFANPDMVGHTGDIPATIAAIEAVDACLGKICPAVLALGGALVITADHGNAEELVSLRTGEINKQHSANPVPLVLVAAEFAGQSTPNAPDAVSRDLSLVVPSGVLADIGPTVLRLLDLPIPKVMTGRPLV